MSEEKNEQGQRRGLQRSLKARHMNMIAIGGAIGTGLFVAGGETVSTAGPGGALLAYSLIGIMVYFLMTGLGEMAAYLPVSGSFEAYASRYVDESLGFALGWNYWFNWAITLAAELVAGALIMKFWFPTVPVAVWSGLFLFCGAMMILGIGPYHSPGFTNWTIGDAPFVGGAMGILSIFMVAGFSFQGTEIIGIAAGESENPEKNVPKAVRTIFWRILLFYLGSFIVIGFLIPYTDPNLLKSDVQSISISPFTLVFKRLGLAGAASLMNAVLLTSVLSSGNSGVYVATRMLYAMARAGQAPKCFLKVNSRGIPINGLYATVAFGLAAFLTSLIGDGVAYNWLVNMSGLAGFIAWIGIAICHYRFRKAYVAQGKDLNKLPYKAPLYPFGPILAFLMCVFVTAGQNYTAFLGDHIDWYGVSVAYIGLPVFLATFLYHKIKYKTHIVPLDKVDLSREE